MGARDEELTKAGTFTGLDNQNKEESLALTALREADNVILDRLGKLKTREGYGAPVVACTNGHSLFGERMVPFLLYADDGILGAMRRDESTVVLRTDLAPGLPVSYWRVNDAIFWCNTVQSGLVTLELEAADWACPNPGSQPRLSAIADGALHPGRIKVACTFMDSRGRESGTGRSAELTLSAKGGVQIDDLPQPLAGQDVAFVRVYASHGDDKALYLAATVPVGLPSYTMLAAPAGRVCATQFLRPLPPGDHVALFDGRQLVASGRYLRWSPALRYGLHHPGHDQLRMAAPIDVLAPVGDGTEFAGVFVCAGDTTYYLSGPEPAQWKQSVPIPTGAVRGTLYYAPAKAWGIDSQELLPAWLNRDGHYTVGLPGGKVATFNDDKFAAGTGESGASLYLEASGIKQFLTTLRGHSQARARVTDKAVARVYREDGKLTPP